MLTKMRLFAYLTSVNVDLVKTVLVVGEIHVLWIHYGDKLTQMILQKAKYCGQKYKIGVIFYVKDAR
jgi:hypothetical protein